MRRVRNRYLLALDAVLLAVAPILAYALRFEGWTWPSEQILTAKLFIALSVPMCVAIFFSFGLYRRLWRYASIAELEQIFLAGVVASIGCAVIGTWILPAWGLTRARVPLSVLFGTSMLNFAIIGTSRLLIRMVGWRSVRRRRRTDRHPVLIAGAGAAGEMVAKELRANPDLDMEPIGFVDDDPQKHGMRLSNLPVLGSLASIPRVIERFRVTEILIAMPRAPGVVVRQVVKAAYDAGIRTRIVPGLFEILSERVSVTAIRQVQIDDLLRRDPVQTDLARVANLARGKTVLVTGAGGSIGSELCRQLAALDPDTLVALDHNENSIFEITGELQRLGVRSRIVPVIADVRNRCRVQHVFEAYRPFAVFHAAAHKHVPLMEQNVGEAITNNVLGTRNLVDASAAVGVKHFVLISTDKVVRPSSVMGATKRVAEFVVHNAALKHDRNFVSVRFGNVLGSQGSVVPTFARQIRDGGPVTVTHPEMRRFFMTIPEAVQLVLQAGVLGNGGELFMLDMGEPVRVLDLARDMIRLSGLEEGADIEIQFTGMRPGEKLYEEMFFGHEVAVPTEHPKILRARNGHEAYRNDPEIASLIDAAIAGAKDDELRAQLRVLVPDFTTTDAIPVPTPQTPEGSGAVPVPRKPAKVIERLSAEVTPA
jgi:FlaA1/EpsC-like NDP-sugar epimerase